MRRYLHPLIYEIRVIVTIVDRLTDLKRLFVNTQPEFYRISRCQSDHRRQRSNILLIINHIRHSQSLPETKIDFDKG